MRREHRRCWCLSPDVQLATALSMPVTETVLRGPFTWSRVRKACLALVRCGTLKNEVSVRFELAEPRQRIRLCQWFVYPNGVLPLRTRSGEGGTYRHSPGVQWRKDSLSEQSIDIGHEAPQQSRREYCLWAEESAYNGRSRRRPL